MGFNLTLVMMQIVLGIVNGTFYAILSLGLAVIFGLLGVINFAHGIFFMLGAYVAYFLLSLFGIGYWEALVIVPLVIGVLGMAVEILLIRRLYNMDHLYGLLLTLGFALLVEGLIRIVYGPQGLAYSIPASLRGAVSIGFMTLPLYRIWVVAFGLILCLATWYFIERTGLGAKLRAATDNPQMTQAFGINVPLMRTATYGAGVALAGIAGVLAAPITSVHPAMGTNFIVIIFAVVVVGGMGSILGSIVTGVGLGVLESLTRLVSPEGSSTVIFVAMVIVLLIRPRGLFGKVA